LWTHLEERLGSRANDFSLQLLLHYYVTSLLEAVHKGRAKSGWEGGLSSADIFRIREVLQMRTSALFSTKNSGFFEIYGASARTRREMGVEAVRTFFGQGVRGSIFCNFRGRPFLFLNFYNIL